MAYIREFDLEQKHSNLASMNMHFIVHEISIIYLSNC